MLISSWHPWQIIEDFVYPSNVFSISYYFYWKTEQLTKVYSRFDYVLEKVDRFRLKFLFSL